MSDFEEIFVFVEKPKENVEWSINRIRTQEDYDKFLSGHEYIRDNPPLADGRVLKRYKRK
jgi:hypothetical protein